MMMCMNYFGGRCNLGRSISTSTTKKSSSIASSSSASASAETTTTTTTTPPDDAFVCRMSHEYRRCPIEINNGRCAREAFPGECMLLHLTENDIAKLNNMKDRRIKMMPKRVRDELIRVFQYVYLYNNASEDKSQFCFAAALGMETCPWLCLVCKRINEEKNIVVNSDFMVDNKLRCQRCFVLLADASKRDDGVMWMVKCTSKHLYCEWCIGKLERKPCQNMMSPLIVCIVCSEAALMKRLRNIMEIIDVDN